MGKTTWSLIVLAFVVGVGAAARLYRLDREGLGNLYYAVSVRSMLMNERNWFFAAFDPAAFVSLDKPPLGFWIQTLSVTLFGFSGSSLIGPQVAAGLVSVALLFGMVPYAFGTLAGLVAALVLALFPVSIATDRSNTPDSLLVLTSLCAAFALLRAAETSRTRWLIAAAVCIGAGCNIKMLQAYIVVPALWSVYLVLGAGPFRMRLAPLLAATAVLFAVSVVWVAAIDLTPPELRPYVGGSRDNTARSLVLEYNGADRLRAPLGASIWSFEIGEPGAWRMFRLPLADQASWLMPLVAVGVTAAVGRSWQQHARQRRSLLLWLGWLLTGLVLFSVGGFIHRYYLGLLAPAIAALVGIGLAALWQCLPDTDPGRLAPPRRHHRHERLPVVPAGGPSSILVARAADWARSIRRRVHRTRGCAAGTSAQASGDGTVYRRELSRPFHRARSLGAHAGRSGKRRGVAARRPATGEPSGRSAGRCYRSCLSG
jgi:4-amino-4-deoxy-L-arabinose transferase-like glycosyltransferase